MLVYTDDQMKQYRLQDCNGFQIYRNDYHSGTRKYMVYNETPCTDDDWVTLEYFWTLREARAFARANQIRG